MATGNGKSDSFDTDGMGTPELLKVLVEGLKQLNETLEVMAEIQESILERLNNLSTDGDGYTLIDE
jgi:hypothetical protein